MAWGADQYQLKFLTDPKNIARKLATTLRDSYNGRPKRYADLSFDEWAVEKGFWWQDRADGEIDYARKDDFNFISCIRLPDFVTREDFDWAVSEAAAKKKLDFSAVELLRVDEGLCVQCMHTGPYDDEPATISAMRAFAAERGYAPDFSEARLHHEIYLSDPRKCAPEKLKTVIRHPIKLI